MCISFVAVAVLIRVIRAWSLAKQRFIISQTDTCPLFKNTNDLFLFFFFFSLRLEFFYSGTVPEFSRANSAPDLLVLSRDEHSRKCRRCGHWRASSSDEYPSFSVKSQTQRMQPRRGQPHWLATGTKCACRSIVTLRLTGLQGPGVLVWQSSISIEWSAGTKCACRSVKHFDWLVCRNQVCL